MKILLALLILCTLSFVSYETSAKTISEQGMDILQNAGDREVFVNDTYRGLYKGPLSTILKKMNEALTVDENESDNNCDELGTCRFYIVVEGDDEEDGEVLMELLYNVNFEKKELRENSADVTYRERVQ